MISSQQKGKMIHATGGKIPMNEEPFRNHYCVEENDEHWESLIEKGFATKREAPFNSGILYHVTK